MASPASCVLLAGLALVLFTWLPGPPFRLDQFDLPKDLALGLIGITCVIFLLIYDEGLTSPKVDALLVLSASWLVLLSRTAASNANMAWRAIGFSCAVLAVFFLARRIGASDEAELAYRLVGLTLVALSLLVVLEAVGAIPFISAPGRRPGAMLGNRNLAARVACLSLPLLWRQIASSERAIKQATTTLMLGVTVASIVFSRSRGAWLVAAGLVIALPFCGWCIRHDQPAISRLRAPILWLTGSLVFGAAAIVLPNNLGWDVGDFTSSARAVGEYQTGTGRGRVIQAETTLRMIRAHPLQGVGPGNWSIMYAGYAQPGDPSVQVAAFYPAPPVPRNDILSLGSELGLPGLVLALLCLGGLGLHTMRMLRSSDDSRASRGVMAAGVIVSFILLGFLDSILRAAPTAMVLAVLLGLVLGEDRAATSEPAANVQPSLLHQAVLVCLASGAAFFATGALQDTLALRQVTTARTLGDLSRAVAVAPHNMEARMLLAYALVDAGHCDLAEVHLASAARLQPFALAVDILRAKCETPTPSSLPAESSRLTSPLLGHAAH